MLFPSTYAIKNNGGTYECYLTDGTLFASGTNLATDVWADILTAETSGNFAVLFGLGTFVVTEPLEVMSGCLILGSGMGTILRASGITTGDRAVFVSHNNNSDGIIIDDMQLDGNYASGGPCHGIRMRNTGESTNNPGTALGTDQVNRFRNLLIWGFGTSATGDTYKGLYLESSTSDMRSNYVTDVYMRENGVNVATVGSSDNYFIGVHTGHSHGDGWQIAGGNNHIHDSKSYFADGIGLLATGARIMIFGFEAQDCGEEGVELQAADFNVTGLTTDSNGRDVTAAGLKISTGAGGTISGYKATNGSSNTQAYGVEFSGTPGNVVMQGQIGSDMLTGAVLGTPGAGSLIHLGIEGSAPYIAGDAPITVVSSNTTLDNTHRIVVCSAAVTLTLPLASTRGGVVIYNLSSGDVTVNTSGSDTFDDTTTSKTIAAKGSLGLLFPGTGTLVGISGSKDVT